jgi:predicted secreted protein
MSITSALVLFAVLWFLTFLVVIPIRLKTHAGAPEDHNLKKKAWITTAIAAVLWGVIASIILSGAITIRDLDVFNRMGPAATNESPADQ